MPSTVPCSGFLYLQFLARCHPFILFDFYTCIVTRTTLFTMFTVIIVVCSYKSMFKPSFILLVLVSYMAIYVPIVMYGLRLFIVVLQELQCLTNCLHVSIIRVIGVYQFTKYFACLHLQVFEIAKCIA